MPKIIAKTLNMPREEWLKFRQKGIGGSDAATICGYNPYSSLIELWADKTGRISPKDDSEVMRQGRDLEEYAAQRFREATGKKVERQNKMFCHNDYDFITANIDRRIIGENAGLECKTTSVFNKSDFENGEIPLYYYCQCCHYMNVMGFDKMYLAVLVLSKAFYWFEIERDEKECKALLDAEINFWNTYVVPDVRPEPDGSESSKKVLQSIYQTQLENTAVLPEEEDNAAKLIDVKARKKQLELEENELTQKLITALDGNTEGLTANYKFSWKKQKRTNVDGKLLKQLYPEVYGKVSNESFSNIFRISERKKK